MFSICGPGQTHYSAPLPVESTSPDLLRGRGRCIKTGAIRMQFPTAEHIRKAYVLTQGRSIVPITRGVRTQYKVLRRLLAQTNDAVPPDSAEALVDMLRASGEDSQEVLNLWTKHGIMKTSLEGRRGLDWSRLTYFFRSLTAVILSPRHEPLCCCECFCKGGECGHIVGTLQCQREMLGHLKDTPLPIAPGGRAGRPPNIPAKSTAFETQEQANLRLEPPSKRQRRSSTPMLPAALQEACCWHSTPSALIAVVPKNLAQEHSSIFATSDALGVECMVHWFGTWEGERAVVTDLVLVDQRAGATWVETVGSEEAQLARFQQEHRVQLLGWAHSHHHLQGTPSLVDVESHWNLQKHHKAPLMAIAFRQSQSEAEDGMRVWTMSKAVVEQLLPSKGKISGSRAGSEHCSLFDIR